ncbi:cell division protein FtsK, partial [bacterium]|nr:cell division protein FtsK [bacterium]
LDANGAEKLLGYGDMLFIPPGVSALQRLHGAYVSEQEVARFVKYLTGNITKLKGEESIFKIQEKIQQSKDSDFSNQDDLYKRAVEIVVTTRMASVSLLQRKLKVGHSRAARLVDMMEEDGIVGPFEGSKTREVLVDKNYITFKGE